MRLTTVSAVSRNTSARVSFALLIMQAFTVSYLRLGTGLERRLPVRKRQVGVNMTGLPMFGRSLSYRSVFTINSGQNITEQRSSDKLALRISRHCGKRGIGGKRLMMKLSRILSTHDSTAFRVASAVFGNRCSI